MEVLFQRIGWCQQEFKLSNIERNLEQALTDSQTLLYCIFIGDYSK